MSDAISRLRDVVARKENPNLHNEYVLKKDGWLWDKTLNVPEAVARMQRGKEVKIIEERDTARYGAQTVTFLDSMADLRTYLRIEGREEAPVSSLERIGRAMDEVEGAGGQGVFYSFGKERYGTYSGWTISRFSPMRAAEEVNGGGMVDVYRETVVRRTGYYGTYLTTTYARVGTITSEEDLIALKEKLGLPTGSDN